MKTSNLLTMMVSTMLMFAGATAQASPATDTIYAQGYMKRANDTAITDGTYTMAFGVFQNGTLLWANEYSVTTVNGLFSQALTGLGGNLSGAALTAAGLAGNFTAITLNPALLDSAASGSVTIRVYAVSPINTANPTFDIPIGSVATSFVASIAKSVENSSITLASLAASAAVNASAGAADAGKIALLNASGLIDSTMLPSISSQGGATSGSNTNISGLNPTGSLAVGGAATTAVNILPTGTNAAVDIASNGTGVLTVGGAGSGTATFGNFGGAAQTVIQSGTGNVAIAGASQFLVPATAFTISQGATATGPLSIATTNNQNLNLAANGTGVVQVGGTSPTINSAGNLTVQSASGSATTLGNSGTTSSTTVQGGTGGTTVSSNGTTATAINLSVGGTNGGITLGANGTGTVIVSGTTPTVTSAAGLTVQGATGSATTVGNTGTSSTTVQSGSGGLTVDPGSGNAVTVGNTGGAATATLRSGTGGTTVSSANTGATAINLSVTGTNGGITLGANGTGVVAVSGTTPTVTASAGGLTVQSASGGTTTVGNTGGAGAVLVQGGTGKIKLQSNGVTGGSFSAMGTCTIASQAWTTAIITNKTCTGAPAGSYTLCQGATAVASQAFNVTVTALNTVSVVASAAGTTAINCLWISP